MFTMSPLQTIITLIKMTSMTLHETYYRDITPGEKNEQRDNSASHDMRSTVRCFQCDNRFSMNSINFVRLISPPRDYADILPHTVTPESAVTDSFPYQPSCYQPNNVQAISQAVTLLYTIELLCPLLSMLVSRAVVVNYCTIQSVSRRCSRRTITIACYMYNRAYSMFL